MRMRLDQSGPYGVPRRLDFLQRRGHPAQKRTARVPVELGPSRRVEKRNAHAARHLVRRRERRKVRGPARGVAADRLVKDDERDERMRAQSWGGRRRHRADEQRPDRVTRGRAVAPGRDQERLWDGEKHVAGAHIGLGDDASVAHGTRKLKLALSSSAAVAVCCLAVVVAELVHPDAPDHACCRRPLLDEGVRAAAAEESTSHWSRIDGEEKGEGRKETPEKETGW